MQSTIIKIVAFLLGTLFLYYLGLQEEKNKYIPKDCFWMQAIAFFLATILLIRELSLTTYWVYHMR